MISALGQHGKGSSAILLFEELIQKFQPDEVILQTVLNACSHAGLIEQASQILHSMKPKYNITPTVKHYTCVVDALARVGNLEDAENIITTNKLSHDIVILSALLGACRTFGDAKRAERIANKILTIDKKASFAYVLLANTYTKVGQWEAAAKIRQTMQDNGIKKIPGRSYIDVDGKIHSFIVEDKSHPQTNEIYLYLTQLNEQMKQHGYKPDTNWVLHDIGEEQKEANLCFHSERLALAYGLLCLPKDEKIIITKNLRMCGDCHSATKLMAKLLGRIFIVRDANRWHHFMPDGTCSCGDHS